jgi:hypothetical protein
VAFNPTCGNSALPVAAAGKGQLVDAEQLARFDLVEVACGMALWYTLLKAFVRRTGLSKAPALTGQVVYYRRRSDSAVDS